MTQMGFKTMIGFDVMLIFLKPILKNVLTEISVLETYLTEKFSFLLYSFHGFKLIS